jgi:hypothetical protein
MTLACVALLAGCTATTSASDGAGYERLYPNAQTRAFIIKNDRPFANEIAAHNIQCDEDRACRK